MPDPAALMREVQAHQRKIDQVRENYTYHRILRTQELDGKGTVRKTTVLEHEVFFVNGHQIRRLVKRDGEPLKEAEDKKEQDRARKLTIEYTGKPAGYGNGGGVNLIDTILAVSLVSNPRRMEKNGRSTLAFDFRGNPKAEAHGLRANGARRVAGTVWIDEADRQVARLEAEFYDNFHVAGGLVASIQKGTTVRIDQSLIAEGLWMPTSIEQQMNMRVVMKSVHEKSEVRNFDFKRFNVDTVQRERK